MLVRLFFLCLGTPSFSPVGEVASPASTPNIATAASYSGGPSCKWDGDGGDVEDEDGNFEDNHDDDKVDDDGIKKSPIILMPTSSGSLQSPLATSSYEGGGRGGAVPQGALKSASRDIRSSSRVL